jgi:hypothetical protein
MPKSKITEARIPLPVLPEQVTTGEGNSTSQRADLTQTPPRRASRKVKPPEDIDSDYAEEAEDFFYGEGM